MTIPAVPPPVGPKLLLSDETVGGLGVDVAGHHVGAVVAVGFFGGLVQGDQGG